jgi:hypothetical protein
MFIWDSKIKNNIAFLITAAIGFASTFYNIKSLPENMNKTIAFAYIPAVLVLIALLLRYVLKKNDLIAKLLICGAFFIGTFIAFIT